MIFKTQYSLLNAQIRANKAGELAKENGWKVAILADDNFFGVPEFVESCKKAEVMPIIGIRHTIEGCEVLSVAQTKEGYAHLTVTTDKEKISFEDLNAKGVVNIVIGFEYKDNIVKAVTTLKRVAVAANKGQRTMEEKVSDNVLFDIADKYNKKILPIKIASFENKEDRILVDTLKSVKMIKEGVRLHHIATDRRLRTKEDQYVADKEEFISSLTKEEKRNFADFIKSCEDYFSWTERPEAPHYPFWKTDAEKFGISAQSEEDFFELLCKRGLEKRGFNSDSKYVERLQFEINVIKDMGFPGYMLIVWDFVNWAKENGIPVGPGRGSAAGSLVAYALEITDINPIEHGLLFERFLNPERVSMPDIDMDFCTNRRGEVINYVSEKYGKKNVARIITFGTLKARGAVRNIGTGFGMNLQLVDRMAKAISDKPDTKLETEKNILSGDEAADKVWELATRLENAKTHYGMHAAGVVVDSDNHISHKCPVIEIDGKNVTQFSMDYMEKSNLIKFDFLGLKTLTVIKDAIDMIDADIDFSKMKFDDQKVFDLISSGHATGLFQIESAGMKELAKKMKPDTFGDVVALIALYRPGPMESGMLDDFIDRKHGRSEITYVFPELEPILKPTYGVIVYQEQVMQIVQTIAGFSLGEADMVRRGMGKKKKEVLDELKRDFVKGAVKNGFDEQKSSDLFDLILKFAGYGFNKSHSAAYAAITYQTAYLKAHYPVEFAASVLNHAKDVDVVGRLATALMAEGIEIVSPDVNTSGVLFTPRNGKVYYGLSQIKGVGAKNVEAVIKNQPYASIEDFMAKNKKITKKVFDGLVKTGAFSKLPDYPGKEALLENFANIKKGLKLSEINKTEDELSETIKDEIENLGFLLSDPFNRVKDVVEKYSIPNLNELSEGPGAILVFPTEVAKKRSKKGKDYVVVSCYYNKQSVDVLAFNQNVDAAESIACDRPVVLKVSKKGDTFFLNAVLPFKNSVLQQNF